MRATQLHRASGIVLLRTISMSMIVLCHLCTFWKAPSLFSQLFTVGVHIFVIISGWLYIDRDIDTLSYRWLFDRWRKLCIPLILWVVIIDLISSLFGEGISAKDLLLLLFNLQGLTWVLPFSPALSNNGVVAGLGHLWFVTIIFLCYILIRIRIIKEHPFAFTIFLLFLSICLAPFGIRLSFFISFFVGCLLKRIVSYRPVVYIISIVVILFSILLRLIGRHYYDGTYLYNILIGGFAQTLLAAGIFVLIKGLVEHYLVLQRISNSWSVRQCDALSYYIYITHYIFLCEQLKLSILIPAIVPQTVAFLALSIISALGLRWVTDQTNSLINRI